MPFRPCTFLSCYSVSAIDPQTFPHPILWLYYVQADLSPCMSARVMPLLQAEFLSDQACTSPESALGNQNPVMLV